MFRNGVKLSETVKYIDINRSVKTVLEKQRYISEINAFCFRDAIAQFRFGVLPLNGNVYRYSLSPSHRMQFSFCTSKTEDEHHVTCECQLYNDLRSKFLYNLSSTSLRSIPYSTNKNQYDNINFIFHALKKKRNISLHVRMKTQNESAEEYNRMRSCVCTSAFVYFSFFPHDASALNIVLLLTIIAMFAVNEYCPFVPPPPLHF